MGERHQTDVRSEVDSSVQDACDPVRSQVSSYHIHVCVGLFICVSCYTDLVSSPRVESAVQNSTKKYWNSNSLHAEERFVQHNQCHVIVFECGYI